MSIKFAYKLLKMNDDDTLDNSVVQHRCFEKPAPVLYYLLFLKQLTSRCAKNKNKKNKLTVNTGQVMFSGEIYYY